MILNRSPNSKEIRQYRVRLRSSSPCKAEKGFPAGWTVGNLVSFD